MLPKPENLDEGVRVGIIGAGAVGLGCAFYLQSRGYQVDVIDPRGPGEGASRGNAGIIATSEVFPVARPATFRKLPRMLLDPIGPLVIRWRYAPMIAPWLVRFLMASRPSEVSRISLALSTLLAPAMDAWRDVVGACGVEDRLVSQGWLKLLRTEADVSAAAREAGVQRELGVAVEVLDARGVSDLEPAIAPNFAGGVFFPTAGNLTSPLGMLRILAEHVAERGVSFVKAEVADIQVIGDRPTVIDTSGMHRAYDRVVIAAGAWSRRLVQRLGSDVFLDTERGYHVMLPTPPHTLKRAVTVLSPGYSMVQMEDGIRLTTGVEFAGLDAAPDFRRIRRMITHAQTTLPGLSSEPLSEWLGFRPSMPRSMPVIGPLENHPHIIVAFGHGHLGLTLGPLTGRIVHAMMSGLTPPVDVAQFLPAQNAR